MTGSQKNRNSNVAADVKIDWQQELTEHQRWLRTVIMARCGEAQAIDEIYQEVASAAIEQKSPLSDPSKAGAWLYQLAVRQSLMYRRKQGRRRKLERNYAERGISLTEHRQPNNPLHWLLADERRQMVRDALDQLHPRDAELLLLKYTENWSYKEISEHLTMTTSAVESRLHRARKRMRQVLTSAKVTEV
ncbi:MAG: sigma-70 family RNA polymerase sigma factor [Pirellulaceae bacterium]|nr:sigma-70 family RNA polymerase sigma factor [Pirellulaceae bacterium]